jgi:hypothetical protein
MQASLAIVAGFLGSLHISAPTAWPHLSRHAQRCSAANRTRWTVCGDRRKIGGVGDRFELWQKASRQALRPVPPGLRQTRACTTQFAAAKNTLAASHIPERRSQGLHAPFRVAVPKQSAARALAGRVP